MKVETITRGVDTGRVLSGANEVKRTLRQRISAALDAATGKDAATKTAEAAIAIFRTLDYEAMRRTALAYLVALAADDARFKAGVTVGRASHKPKSYAPPGGKQNLTKPMPKDTRYAGETFTAANRDARYAEWLARRDAEQAKKETTDA
jgi:hypothetical protein